MARPIDTNMPNINPQVRGAGETAGQLKIDQKLLDKVLAKQGLGSPEQLAKLFGPEILSYFRAMSESLNVLCNRMQESDVKSLPAQRMDPKLNEFMARDTSKGTIYQDRLPEGFLNPDKLSLMVKTGLLKPAEAKAIDLIFNHSPHKEDVHTQFTPPSTDKERGQGDQQQKHQQQEQESEEDSWADFSTQGVGGSDGNAGGSLRSSMSASGGENAGGNFAGGSLRSSMRMGMGAPGGGNSGGFGGPPPPPPQGGSSGNMQNQSSGLQGQIQNSTGQEQSYLNSNFSPGDPYYSSFETLFGSENWYRNVAGSAMSSIQQIRDAKQQILAQLAGLDPTKPADAKQLYILQQKLGDLQGTERQYMDNISMAQKANNERKEYMKAILDIFFQTNSAIIKNLRQ